MLVISTKIKLNQLVKLEVKDLLCNRDNILLENGKNHNLNKFLHKLINNNKELLFKIQKKLKNKFQKKIKI